MNNNKIVLLDDENYAQDVFELMSNYTKELSVFYDKDILNEIKNQFQYKNIVSSLKDPLIKRTNDEINRNYFGLVNNSRLEALAIKEYVVGANWDWLAQIYSSQKRKGFGLNLMEYCISDSINQNMEEMGLDVSVHNAPALNMYRKLGFEEETCLDDTESMIRMWKRL